MKSTGIVRKVDELGRIVLPIEMRRTLDIAERDPLEIYVEGDGIVLKKVQSACVFCGKKHLFGGLGIVPPYLESSVNELRHAHNAYRVIPRKLQRIDL